MYTELRVDVKSKEILQATGQYSEEIIHNDTEL